MAQHISRAVAFQTAGKVLLSTAGQGTRHSSVPKMSALYMQATLSHTQLVPIQGVVALEKHSSLSPVRLGHQIAVQEVYSSTGEQL